MYIESILRYARERKFSLQDAAQTFLQVVVLRRLSAPQARFMGGTALVLGYGNPRFSEDVDLTQVSDLERLGPGLLKAKTELEGWFGSPVILRPPKTGGRTWRLTLRRGRSESLSLHVDSQPYRAYTMRPIVIEYPSIPPFVCEALELDEILSEKIVAVACRRYLGGRDLFDLWFHWLRSDAWADRKNSILELVTKKLRERSLKDDDFKRLLTTRLSENVSLNRARHEWKRYLPPDFQKATVFSEIVTRCRLLTEIVS